jgi:glycosyltransferase involved in cell wall biosynthesis
VVGDGDDRARLEHKAVALGLTSRVTFLGRVDDAALEREYERCTAFVMPSNDEGFGFVFVEAMRAGRACIASPGAAAEIVDHGVSGLIVDPSDRDHLTRSVVQLLSHPADADRMGARGRAHFLRDFTEARFRERFSTLLDAGVPVLAE